MADQTSSHGDDRRRRRRGPHGPSAAVAHRPREPRRDAGHVYAPPVHVPPPPDVEPVRDLLAEILERMGVREAQVGYYVRPEGEYLEVRGPELASLIGRHGNTLEALNLLVNAIVGASQKGGRRYYTIDAEGYRARRADALKSLALQALERAVRERRPQTLEPMLPSERKIIHIALAESPFVSTESTGVEPERRIVVAPR